MHDLIQELRQILRGLGRAPGFTLVALLTLALGIGATTAVYSLVYGVTMKGLPFPEAERLLCIYETSAQVEGRNVPASAPNFADWRERSHTLSALSARQGHAANLTGLGDPERLRGEAVTWNHFEVLGLKPLLGRTFRAEEDVTGSAPVCLVSRPFWQRRFGGDPGIVGRTLELNGVPTLVLGVLPEDHRKDIAYWVPLRLQPQATDRHYKQLEVMGRLRPGVPLMQAQAEFQAIAGQLATDYPELCAGWTTRVLPMPEALVVKARPILRLLGWAVGFVLLLTCTNLANLQLARSAGRAQDHALRLAVGATPFRVARTLLLESGLLGLAGGLLGLALAAWGIRVFVALNPANLPRIDEIGLQFPVVAFAFGISLLAGLAFGALPAWQAGQQAVASVLREGGAGKATSLRGMRLRSALVVVQVGLALVLMTGAGLLLRSLHQLLQVEPGFRTERLLTLQLPLPMKAYPDPQARATFQAALLDRLRAQPGVEAVTTSNVPPLTGSGARFTYHVRGRALPRLGDVVIAHFRLVGPGYFKTLGIPVVQGRDVASTDDGAGEPVVFINQSMARKLWPNENPLGRQLCLGVPLDGEEATWWTVAGVVGDVRQTSLEEEPGLEFYHPLAQDSHNLARGMGVVLRGTGNPTTLVPGIREAVLALDSTLPLTKIRTMATAMEDGRSDRTVTLGLVGLFAVLALVLTGVGVYGVMNHSVTQRERELGIRVALGAGKQDLLRLVLGQALNLTLIGLGLGVAVSLLSGRLLSGLLFGVAALDPFTLLVVGVLVLVLTLLAALLPALRAARVQPAVALRSE